MVVASDVALAVFGLVFASVIPGLLIYGKYRLQHRSDWLGIALSWCHPLVVSCILGAIVGNAGLNRHSKTVNDILELASEVTVGIALPLLLYSCDLRQLKTLGGRCLLVFGLGAVSVLIAASLAWLTFRSVMGHKPAADVAGLMVAVFTGGTANMAAAQVALDVDQDLFIATMTTELGIAALYIFSAIVSGILSTMLCCMHRTLITFVLYSPRLFRRLLNRHLPSCCHHSSLPKKRSIRSKKSKLKLITNLGNQIQMQTN
eukprot:gb/GECG01013349.1/.p1 GENE.gb/GECG01013349.1/~~gb/GECG01013349.1/.p1  ORF type:complete len:260 (+),score=3.35 gb/GECG01013349.1/:1-780(+)